MESDHKISDELLAKYLSGQASPEEAELALTYLSENDENLEDLTAMVAAVELQRDADAAARHAAKVRLRRRVLWTLSSAAAVALFIVAGWALWPRGNTPDNSSTLATRTDTLPKHQSATSTHAENANGQASSSAEVRTATATPGWQEIPSKDYAAGHVKTNFCTMSSPASTACIIPNNRATFDFSWDTDAVNQMFTLSDQRGALLFSADVDDDDYIKFNTSDYKKYGEIHWRLSLTFADGTVGQKQGIITFE